ncbi:hypothetical protein IZY60_05575 [Lutibacter sp. B2]|nr:hypothetical protein [Lutibacter sp. B2]
MNKRKFTVIKGNKIENNPYEFIKAKATNTRLMGVIGIVIEWKTPEGEILNQLFHLDAEEYGIDDYIPVLGEDQARIQIANMMGGLGGEFVDISEKEARYLVKNHAQKNKEYAQILPEPESEYNFILEQPVDITSEEILDLWNKICEEIKEPNQLINYFVMRAAGLDDEGVNYLSSNKNIQDPIVKKPSTLLKNNIEKIEENLYMTESLIDIATGYRMLVSQIEIENTEIGIKVKNAKVQSSMKLTSIEAAFSLRKREYLIVYEVKDLFDLVTVLEDEKPQTMKNEYDQGVLYTEFNPNNKHVGEETYYINDDIHGIYYLTTANQLIIGAQTEEKITELALYFESDTFKDTLKLNKRVFLENSILYEFVHSDENDIFEFINIE